MRLDDSYALLDIRPGATEDEVKRAHRDLAKVWHPDRFANDTPLRRKAEEKLKDINDAYETILASRAGGTSGRWRAPDHPQTETDAPRRDSVRQVVRNRTWALTCLAAALFVLVRRPTPGGLLIALLLFCAAIVFAMRLRAGRHG
jgi:Flp pilus assembly protein TadB